MTRRTVLLSMAKIRQVVSLVLAAAISAPLFLVAAAFASNYKARVDAARYLRIVMPLRLGTSYDAAVTQLRNAGVAADPTTRFDDCPRDCTLIFTVGDVWLYRLHLAPPVGFYGRLDFKNGALVYKVTSLGQDVMVWNAAVSEGSSLEPHLGANVDSSGQIRQIHINLSPSDSTEFRSTAYDFKLACIGSMRGCTAVDYLPWNDLRRLATK